MQSAPGGKGRLEDVLLMRPNLSASYRRFVQASCEEGLLPPPLLALCAARVAALHGCDLGAFTVPVMPISPRQGAALERWAEADCFSPLERAALLIADKMPWRHADIDDADVQALRAHLSDRQVVALTVAIAMFDCECRLQRVVAPVATQK